MSGRMPAASNPPREARCHLLSQMTEIDYATVNRYWEAAAPSVLGPYMMDGFGFPVSAGDFRFRAELRIVQRLAGGVKQDGAVLDLGSGVGFWAEDFASHFSQVIAVEGSEVLYRALEKRCAPYANVRAVHGNVMSFEPDGRYNLIFLGGMLMYLNEEDVIDLLRRIIPFLEPGGMILCRESTVRGETVARQGDYQVVYRSVSDYGRIFETCGLGVHHVERNLPYVLMQMGCELVRSWKETVPDRFQFLLAVGHLTYFVLRLGNPWITRVPKVLGIPFPKLENHFFVLEPHVS
jgi:SAM-dependent methyltransferase